MQEELAANQTHQTGLEGQIKDLRQSQASLEQELGRRDQKIQQQDQALKELQKQHVIHGAPRKMTSTFSVANVHKKIYCGGVSHIIQPYFPSLIEKLMLDGSSRTEELGWFHQ